MNEYVENLKVRLRAIRKALGPYNDDERPLSELISVLVAHVNAASTFRQILASVHGAAALAIQSGEHARALNLLMSATQPTVMPGESAGQAQRPTPPVPVSLDEQRKARAEARSRFEDECLAAAQNDEEGSEPLPGPDSDPKDVA